MKPTYDEIQMGAVLTYCFLCERAYYATHPTPGWICIRCRQAEEGRTRPAIGKSVDARLSLGSALTSSSSEAKQARADRP